MRVLGSSLFFSTPITSEWGEAGAAHSQVATTAGHSCEKARRMAKPSRGGAPTCHENQLLGRERRRNLRRRSVGVDVQRLPVLVRRHRRHHGDDLALEQAAQDARIDVRHLA